MKDSNLSSGVIIKKSNIRIWIHQRDLAHLQQVIWEGHGSKLLVEHSNNPKVKKFLEAVPHIMGLIRDIHTDVQNDDLESLKTHTNPPIPPIVLSGKDSNGLTALHKAAGLGRQEMAEYIVERYPNSVSIIDNEGRSPLHYAALAKDDGKLFDFLIGAGADESLLDNKQKTAAYYKTRNSELDQKLLSVVPESPRSAKESFAATFDWSLLTSSPATEAPVKTLKKAISENGDNPPSETTEPDSEQVTEEKHVAEEPENNHKEEEEEPIQNGKEETPREEPEPAEPPAEEKQEEEPEAEAAEEEKVHDEPPKEEEKTENEEKLENGDKEEEPAEPEKHEEQTEEITTEKTETEPNTTEVNHDSNTEENESEHKEENEVNSAEEPEEPSHTEENDKSEEHAIPHHEEPAGEHHVVNADEGVIEGIVNGENEIESVNEQGQGVEDKADDAEIVGLIEEANMEQLAALVLNGDGERLVGHHSDNPELQAFLDNVPIYMSKINRIHVAARDGSLRDLQAALDRRKFAIAKDPISPNEASPLHVAVIFGNTSIVRYLAGRFPETVQTVDVNARTPLHYAAVLADNGHYYNLLVHLGADVRAEDKLGNIPDYYRTNQNDFSHRLLLRDFGAEETADEILNDKDKSANNVQVDMPFFYTEEGRYLASSLGDPLIKGLTEVANKRPDDPIAYLATYLYNFANNNKSRVKTQETQQVITGPPQDIDNNNAVPTTIDVVTLDPEEDNSSEEETAFSGTSRDEHGQSMLHFAAARSHGRNALFQLLEETNINIGYRDELYRTARDISIQANIPENTNEIDRYVMHIACKGDTDKLVELLLNGYDHITDIVDEDDVPIIEAVSSKEQNDTVAFLQSILTFEEKRERVHHAIRQGAVNEVTQLLADEKETGSGKLLAIGRNSYGRCTLHIAVLCQQEEIVDFLVNTFPETLHVGDNLERTALHYAMGVEKMESISKLLIKAGAKRVAKDLKGRQPTYYFMNKSDILRLQEEEETF
ncbi:hypothetical protein ILUMI_26193 [Ignelater luminosus]|uniref:Uncharacterized protein n=1 Tax=Ignelater luminosus TaxID=2038154 RepID=A0A8K0FYW8_IGNLU|nr:hypothetical protein ILUMI_26193 [Ignelater luminosus]